MSFLQRSIQVFYMFRFSATSLADIRRNADWMCTLVNLASLAFAVVEGLFYNNVNQALLWGIPLFLVSLTVSRFHSGQPLTMYINALTLTGMGALHVHLAQGLTEFHFSFFMLLPVLLAYRDVRPLITMGSFIIVQHIAFNALQQLGFECYVFRGPFAGLPAVTLHGFYVAIEVLILSTIAVSLKQHAVVAEESARLLGHLNSKDRVNLRARAHATEDGELSAVGQVFNDYVNNMTFVVAAFKMLRSDIRELSDIARELGTGNQLQIEDSLQASKSLGEFIQNLGQQTRMGQSTADLAKKITDDCFDLINGLNQSLEQLQKISKQSYDSRQSLAQLHRQCEPDANPNPAEQLKKAHLALGNILGGLENMNERTQGFMVNMDLLKSGLSAIENQVVAVDRATHEWVENGHHNQRQGWEVLGAMESMQARAEKAFRRLNDTIETILRTDELMREMEQRLSRFEV